MNTHVQCVQTCRQTLLNDIPFYAPQQANIQGSHAWRWRENMVGLRREGAPTLLHNDRRRIGSSLAALRDGESLHESRQEAADIRIASSVRVNELLLRQGNDWILCALPMYAHDRGLTALRDDHCPLRPLRAWHEREPRGDKPDVGRVPALRLGPRQGLCFIAEEVIDVRKRLHKDRLKWRHLHEKRRRQVHAVKPPVRRLL